MTRKRKLTPEQVREITGGKSRSEMTPEESAEVLQKLERAQDEAEVEARRTQDAEGCKQAPGSVLPKCFVNIDWRRNTCKFDHGLCYRDLKDKFKLCKIKGSIARLNETGQHYVRGDDWMAKAIIDLTDEDGYWYDYTDKRKNTTERRQLRYATTKQQRKEVFDYALAAEEDHPGLDERYHDFPNGRIDFNVFYEIWEEHEAGNIDDDEMRRRWMDEAFDQVPHLDTYSTNPMIFNFNPNAKFDLLDQVLSNLSRDRDGKPRENIILTYHEIVGAIMHRNPKVLQQVNFPVIIGPSGCGKSLFFDSVRYAFGSENVATCRLQDWGMRFVPDIEKLPNALVYIDEDMDTSLINGTAMSRIRIMTTGGEVSFDRKNIPASTFMPQGIFLTATNSQLDLSSKEVNDALEERITFIPAEYKVRGTAEDDRTLFNRMACPEMAEYLLLLGLIGLCRLKKTGHYSVDEEDKALKEQLLRETNTIEAWLADNNYGAWRFTEWDPDYGNHGDLTTHIENLGNGKTREYRFPKWENPWKEYKRWCAMSGSERGMWSERKFSPYICRKFRLYRGESTYSSYMQKNWRAYIDDHPVATATAQFMQADAKPEEVGGDEELY